MMMKKVKYTVVIEKGERNYGAYVPDLPGCVAVSDSPDKIVELIREAIQFHLEGIVEDGDPIPPGTTRSVEIETQVAA